MLADWHNKEALGQNEVPADGGASSLPSINQVASGGVDLKAWALPFGVGGLIGLILFFLLAKRLPKLGAAAVSIGAALVSAGVAKKVGI